MDLKGEGGAAGLFCSEGRPAGGRAAFSLESKTPVSFPHVPAFPCHVARTVALRERGGECPLAPQDSARQGYTPPRRHSHSSGFGGIEILCVLPLEGSTISHMGQLCVLEMKCEGKETKEGCFFLFFSSADDVCFVGMCACPSCCCETGFTFFFPLPYAALSMLEQKEIVANSSSNIMPPQLAGATLILQEMHKHLYKGRDCWLSGVELRHSAFIVLGKKNKWGCLVKISFVMPSQAVSSSGCCESKTASEVQLT